MKLFLCSHFSSVGSLIKEEIDNKKVAFIPTASLREGYTGYVGSARKLFNKLGAAVTEIDISTEAYLTIQSVFEDADVIYFTGGNSFFLMDQLRKTGTDELLKKELEKGKLMIGESAGAIICAPTIQYIEQMDEKPEDYSQEDDAGLGLIDLQGLRKSGQMHKIRLTKNNYQLVAANAGQSPEVLMHHYNEALEVEKQQLASMVESSFYPTPAKSNEKPASLDAAEILKLIQENPDLSAKLMQLLKVSA